MAEASCSGLEPCEELLGEFVGLSCTAVVSCMVCSLVSISNAAVPLPSPVPRPMKPKPPPPAPPLDRREPCGGGSRLQTQQAPKKVKATSRRIGPMMMGGLPEGISVVKAKAPTRVMLIPASMIHSPQAQHKAGDGRPWGRDFLFRRLCDSFLGTEVPELRSLHTIWSRRLKESRPLTHPTRAETLGRRPQKNGIAESRSFLQHTTCNR